MFQIFAEFFAGIEARVVRHPLSPGGGHKKRALDPVPSVLVPDSEHITSAPQGTGGGGGPSSLVTEIPTLVNASEFAHLPPSAKSPSVFHRRARERVRRVAIAAELLDPDPSHTLFITATAPFSNIAAARPLAENSGWVIKRLKNWLRQFQLQDRDFYVWERHKNGSLHLHYSCYCPSPDVARKIKSGFHLHWVQTLRALSVRTGLNLFLGKGGQDWSQRPQFVRVEVQEVKKSIARYMAKYLSKEHGNRSASFAGVAVSPRRWWGASETLKAEADKLTERVRVPNLSWLDSRNMYERIKLAISPVIELGNYFESRSEQCDAESFTLYLQSGMELVKKAIYKLQPQFILASNMKTEYQLAQDQWKASNSLPALQLMNELVKTRHQNAGSKAALQLLTHFNEFVLNAPSDHLRFMNELCLIYENSIARLERARRSVPYRSKVQADADVLAVQVVIADAWREASTLALAYKRTIVNNC